MSEDYDVSRVYGSYVRQSARPNPLVWPDLVCITISGRMRLVGVSQIESAARIASSVINLCREEQS